MVEDQSGFLWNARFLRTNRHPDCYLPSPETCFRGVAWRSSTVLATAESPCCKYLHRMALRTLRTLPQELEFHPKGSSQWHDTRGIQRATPNLVEG